MENTVFELAVMVEDNGVRPGYQRSSRFFVGRIEEVANTFVGTVDLFCIRMSAFYLTKEEAERSELLSYIVVEKGPLVLDGSLKYFPSHKCLSPISHVAVEMWFGKRIHS
jgi:hypothetical protein